MADTPTHRDFSWRSLVEGADKDHDKDPYVYRFSNGREFKSTDKTDSGIYRKG